MRGTANTVRLAVVLVGISFWPGVAVASSSISGTVTFTGTAPTLRPLAMDADPLCFQGMEAAIRRSRLGAYLSPVHSFLSMQRRSEYVNKVKGAGEGVQLLAGQGKFLFVYPFVKTREWYLLSPHARQGLMDEHIAASAPFKGVHLNTSYSFGLDDQDFVVAFDSDYPQEFVDLVGRLRYTAASLYTQRDTPMFACAKAPIETILAQLTDAG